MDEDNKSEIIYDFKKIYGKEFGKAMHFIISQWSELNVLWSQYKYLFSEDKNRTEFLYKCGQHFVYRLEYCYFQTIVLIIRRLTDNDEKSITLEIIKEYCDNSELDSLITQAQKAAEYFRKYRNKIIAHNDKKVVYKNINVISGVTIRNVNNAIKSIYRVIKFIIKEYEGMDIDEEATYGSPNEVDILNLIYMGKKYEKILENTGKERLIPPDNPPDWI